MADFPRTKIEDVSVSRLLIGTNWFFGYSHTSKAKDSLIRSYHSRKTLAEIMTVFLEAGVDTVYGARPEAPLLQEAIADAEQATGRKAITLGIPHLDIGDGPAALAQTGRILDNFAKLGVKFLLPHQATTDALVDRRKRSLPGMEVYCRMIRERGMIPGLSTHMPETPVYADESGLDVATYIQIYNPLGFLMQIEVDWVHRMIWNCKKPVIVIKPMAAGRCLPLVGMSFAWSTLREQDMVCAGVMTADEAREIVDLSWAILERRSPTVELQRTRSKESVERRK